MKTLDTKKYSGILEICKYDPKKALDFAYSYGWYDGRSNGLDWYDNLLKNNLKIKKEKK